MGSSVAEAASRRAGSSSRQAARSPQPGQAHGAAAAAIPSYLCALWKTNTGHSPPKESPHQRIHPPQFNNCRAQRSRPTNPPTHGPPAGSGSRWAAHRRASRRSRSAVQSIVRSSAIDHMQGNAGVVSADTVGSWLMRWRCIALGKEAEAAAGYVGSALQLPSQPTLCSPKQGPPLT